MYNYHSADVMQRYPRDSFLILIIIILYSLLYISLLSAESLLISKKKNVEYNTTLLTVLYVLALYASIHYIQLKLNSLFYLEVSQRDVVYLG
jgi:hypothetical protein